MIDTYLVSKEDYSEINRRSQVNQYDILFGMIGTIGNPVIVMNREINFVIKNVGLLKFNGDYNLAQWVYYFLNSEKFKSFIDVQLAGSSQKFVSLNLLRSFQITIPVSKEERTRIILVLSAQDRKIETEETNLAKLQNLKKGLMGDLLSGDVRVKG